MLLPKRFTTPFALMLAACALVLMALGLARISHEGESERQLIALALRSCLWAALGLSAWQGRRWRSKEPSWPALALAIGLASALLGWMLPLVLQDHLAPPGQPVLESGALRAAYLFVALGLAPLGEELLFRGALFSSLEARRGPRMAIVGSALAFALFHLHPAQLPLALVAGLALGWLRGRYGALLPCIAAHVVHNWLILSAGG